MSLKLNNLNIEGMKFGGHKVIGGMLNGQNLFTFEGTPYMSFRINTSLTMNNNFTICTSVCLELASIFCEYGIPNELYVSMQLESKTTCKKGLVRNYAV